MTTKKFEIRIDEIITSYEAQEYNCIKNCIGQIKLNGGMLTAGTYFKQLPMHILDELSALVQMWSKSDTDEAGKILVIIALCLYWAEGDFIVTNDEIQKGLHLVCMFTAMETLRRTGTLHVYHENMSIRCDDELAGRPVCQYKQGIDI